MRRTVLLLSVATIGLSLACAYLYRELQVARAQRDAAVATARESRTLAAPAAVPNVDPQLPAADIAMQEPRSLEGRPFEPFVANEPTTTRANRREELRAQLEQRRADPAWRARALARAKYSVRQGNPDLGSALELDAEREAALVELLAQQEVQLEDANAPMRFATNAERSALQEKANALAAQHQQEIAQFLGARYSSYTDYMREIPERRQLRELRSRLDESNTLTNAQSARLIDAMYAERDSYLQQLKSLEGKHARSTEYPLLAMRIGGDAAERVRFAEDQVEQTEAFMSRIRLRAAEVLSAEQLRRFDEIQEEQRVMAQSQLERARRQAAREQARR